MDGDYSGSTVDLKGIILISREDRIAYWIQDPVFVDCSDLPEVCSGFAVLGNLKRIVNNDGGLGDRLHYPQ